MTPPYPGPEDELDDRNITLNTGFDVVYHGGRFYYMTACGRIWALDAAAPPGSPVEMVLFATSQVPGCQLLRYGKHLVFSEDGALHVVWSDLDGMPRMGSKGSLVRRWHPMRIEVRAGQQVGMEGGASPWWPRLPDRHPQSVGVLGGAGEEEDVAESQLRLLHQHYAGNQLGREPTQQGSSHHGIQRRHRCLLNMKPVPPYGRH